RLLRRRGASEVRRHHSSCCTAATMCSPRQRAPAGSASCFGPLGGRWPTANYRARNMPSTSSAGRVQPVAPRLLHASSTPSARRRCPRRPVAFVRPPSVSLLSGGAPSVPNRERAAMTDETVSTAKVGQVDIAYETFGKQDHPPVVLIMGFASQM